MTSKKIESPKIGVVNDNSRSIYDNNINKIKATDVVVHSGDFTMAGSEAEATMLKKVMTWRLIGIFFGVTTLIIILSGCLFNIIL